MITLWRKFILNYSKDSSAKVTHLFFNIILHTFALELIIFDEKHRVFVRQFFRDSIAINFVKSPRATHHPPFFLCVSFPSDYVIWCNAVALKLSGRVGRWRACSHLIDYSKVGSEWARKRGRGWEGRRREIRAGGPRNIIPGCRRRRRRWFTKRASSSRLTLS